MATQGNDVGALFKSFGADGSSFRELARNADAGAAEQRWPLLKSMAPERRESPPVLSTAQKNELWTGKEPKAPRMRDREMSRSGTGLGEKLAKGLRQMSDRIPTVVAPVPARPVARPVAEAPRAPVPRAPVPRAPVPRAAAPRPAAPRPAAPRPAAPRPSRPASKGRGFLTKSEAAPAPVFAPKPKPIEPPRESTLFARAEAPKPVRPKKGGLFARAETEPVVRKQEVASGGSATLASTFRRIAGQEEPVAKPTSSRPSFLKRLGRG